MDLNRQYRIRLSPQPRVRTGYLLVFVTALLASGCPHQPQDKAGGSSPQSPPKRIITIAPNTAEIVCELGAFDRLVAVSRYCEHPPRLADLPKIGGPRDLDLETILALKPDLVMLRGSYDVLEKLCRDHDIRTYHDPTETLDDLERTIVEIGDLLGLSERAAEIVSRVREELADVRRSVKGLPKPRVLFIMRSPDQLANLTTVARGSYLSELIALAGGENIFKDQDAPYPLVGLEEILGRQPEVIIESLFDTKDTPDLRERVLEQWRAVGSIPAVRTGRIHVLTTDYAMVPSPRAVRMATDLVKIIHPEVAVDAE